MTQKTPCMGLSQEPSLAVRYSYFQGYGSVDPGNTLWGVKVSTASRVWSQISHGLVLAISSLLQVLMLFISMCPAGQVRSQKGKDHDCLFQKYSCSKSSSPSFLTKSAEFSLSCFSCSEMLSSKTGCIIRNTTKWFSGSWDCSCSNWCNLSQT